MTMTLSGSGTIAGLVAGGLPDATITQPDLAAGVAGNGPAFSAYSNVTQSITSNVWTKVRLPNEDFDTNNNFDNTTNYRFTPTVAGYYQINGQIRTDGTSTTSIGVEIYKNGSQVSATVLFTPTTTNQFYIQCSKLIYMNGSTDYVELYGAIVATSPSFSNNQSQFNGALVRAA